MITSGQGLTGNNMFAYCGNNPVTREDKGGEAWNIVIGAVVGAVIGGAVAAVTSYKQNGKIDWTSVAINAVVGGVCGAVAATGMNMFVQAGISAFASGTGNLFDQAQSKGWNGINGWDVAVSTALGFGTAWLGTGAGKIIGGKWAKEASRLTNLGRDKLLTGFLRQSVGQSHSSLIRQGYRYIAQAVRPTNIYQGVSSVAGSFISGAVGFGYNMLKSSVLGW